MELNIGPIYKFEVLLLCCVKSVLNDKEPFWKSGQSLSGNVDTISFFCAINAARRDYFKDPKQRQGLTIQHAITVCSLNGTENIALTFT